MLKAKALGMTRRVSPIASGLSSLNVSNARDLVKLVNAASRDPVVREFSTLPSHEVRVGKSMLAYRNTNLLIGKPDWEILVQKTGYTNDAGQCLVMEAMIGERPVDHGADEFLRQSDAHRRRAADPKVDGSAEHVAARGRRRAAAK